MAVVLLPGQPAARGRDAAEKPASADAGTSVDNYPAVHSRLTIANVEFFLLDTQSHRSSIVSGTTMLGATQLAWLKARLLASTADHKIVVSAKKTIGSTNDDGWALYTTERDEILDYIESNVVGVTWICGDQHDIEVNERQTARGANHDHVVLCTAPTTNENPSGGGNIDSTTIHRAHRTEAALAGDYQFRKGYGIGIADANQVEFSIKSTFTGRDWFPRILRSKLTNRVSYPAGRFSV